MSFFIDFNSLDFSELNTLLDANNNISELITITPSIVNSLTTPVNITINKTGEFYIVATTKSSDNYDSVTITSTIKQYNTSLDKPVIVFPTQSEGFITNITFGETYTLKEAIFQYPKVSYIGLSIEYISMNTNIATISGTNVTILSAGKFSIMAPTTQNGIHL